MVDKMIGNSNELSTIFESDYETFFIISSYYPDLFLILFEKKKNYTRFSTLKSSFEKPIASYNDHVTSEVYTTHRYSDP